MLKHSFFKGSHSLPVPTGSAYGGACSCSACQFQLELFLSHLRRGEKVSRTIFKNETKFANSQKEEAVQSNFQSEKKGAVKSAKSWRLVDQLLPVGIVASILCC